MVLLKAKEGSSGSLLINSLKAGKTDETSAKAVFDNVQALFHALQKYTAERRETWFSFFRERELELCAK